MQRGGCVRACYDGVQQRQRRGPRRHPRARVTATHRLTLMRARGHASPMAAGHPHTRWRVYVCGASCACVRRGSSPSATRTHIYVDMCMCIQHCRSRWWQSNDGWAATSFHDMHGWGKHGAPLSLQLRSPPPREERQVVWPWPARAAGDGGSMPLLHAPWDTRAPCPGAAVMPAGWNAFCAKLCRMDILPPCMCATCTATAQCSNAWGLHACVRAHGRLAICT